MIELSSATSIGKRSSLCQGTVALDPARCHRASNRSIHGLVPESRMVEIPRIMEGGGLVFLLSSGGFWVLIHNRLVIFIG